jgi:hypothetical protein
VDFLGGSSEGIFYKIIFFGSSHQTYVPDSGSGKPDDIKKEVKKG